MKKSGLVAMVILLVGLLGYGYQALDHAGDDEGLSIDFASWPPTTSEVLQKLPDAGTPPTPAKEKEREGQYAKLFTSRFRNHDPAMAVGMRFLPDEHIKLMCPARMEPWNMDRLAITAWRETRDMFGRTFDVDIYATYIGAPPVLVGQLRPTKEDSKQVNIRYFLPGQIGTTADTTPFGTGKKTR